MEIAKSKIEQREHMKKACIMSPIRRTIPGTFLPTLPIEIWLTAQPLLNWSLVENEDDCIFQFNFHDREHPGTYKRFRGTEYVEGLLTIETPRQLVSFMNTYACPIDGTVVKDPVDGKYHQTPASFHWRAFIEAQAKLRNARHLPIPKLLRHPELHWSFDLYMQEIIVMTERRDGAYYGTVTLSPSLESCCQVIAFERLLANATYGFCGHCGKSFEVSSGHKRKYCKNPNCGHAVAQRAYRERQKRKRGKKK
jgi:hypothetical protein